MKVLALMNGFGGYWRLSGLFFLLVVALGLRIHQLDHESLFMDEIQQVSVYPYDFVTLIEKAAIDQQPPLDYWIGHMVYFFSTTDTAVRLPAVLFGIGSVLLLAALIGRHANGVTAFLGGLFLAFLPFHIYFFRRTRGLIRLRCFYCC